MIDKHFRARQLQRSKQLDVLPELLWLFIGLTLMIAYPPIESGFRIKRFKSVRPVSKICCVHAAAAYASSLLDRLIRQVTLAIESIQFNGGKLMAELDAPANNTALGCLRCVQSPKYNGCVKRANAGDLSIGAVNAELPTSSDTITPIGRVSHQTTIANQCLLLR